MVADIFHHIHFGRGYWRTAPFGEMTELYASRFLRHIAQGMVGIMVAIFLYQNGYNLVTIMLYIAYYYGVRAIASYLSGYYVAWSGPKRATLISNVLAVPALVSLTMIDEHMALSAGMFFTFQAVSLSLYTIASDMQFSSLKTTHHVGKELGWLHTVEKIATGVAPMIGGFVAYWLGPESTMWIAAVLSIFASLPLFITPEKIRRKQKIIYQGMPWRTVRSHFMTMSIAGADQVVSGATWSIFVGVIIFGTQSDVIYAQLGVLFSISLFVAIAAAHVYGAVIDRHKGETLYRVGIAINALIHAVRPFTVTPVSVGLLNSANEVGTSAYQMPLFRSEYDTADELPGYRVAYISTMMVFFCLGAMLLSLATAALIWQFGGQLGLALSFVLMAFLTFGMIPHRFTILRR